MSYDIPPEYLNITHCPKSMVRDCCDAFIARLGVLGGRFCGAGNLLKSSHLVPSGFPFGSQQPCWEPPEFRLPFRFPVGSQHQHQFPITGDGNHQNFDSQPFPFGSQHQHQFPSTLAGNELLGAFPFGRFCGAGNFDPGAGIPSTGAGNEHP